MSYRAFLTAAALILSSVLMWVLWPEKVEPHAALNLGQRPAADGRNSPPVAAPERQVDAVHRQPEVPAAQATAVPNEGAARLSRWLTQSGYELLQDFLPTEAIATLPITKPNPYYSYDLSNLRVLAGQGDSVAAFYYASNPQVADEEAAAYFEMALVNGGYAVAAFQAAMRYDNLAYDQASGQPLYETLRANPQMELTQPQSRYLEWLAIGAELGDPLSRNLLNQQILPSLSASQQQALAAQARDSVARLNGERFNKGRAPLAVLQMPAEALAYIERTFNEPSKQLAARLKAEDAQAQAAEGLPPKKP